jgi:hypothetical protein
MLARRWRINMIAAPIFALLSGGRHDWIPLQEARHLATPPSGWGA